jgi:uncharacterized protein with PhoU and TrkA domain
MNTIVSKLLELKNTSELMIDLAYSSLLFYDREIAEEVIALEESMDAISKEIQEEISIVGRSSPDDFSKLMILLKLQMAIENIADAAASIADVVIRGLGDHPVIRMSIQDSDVVVTMATVSSGSKMIGRTFGDMKLSSQCGMFVVAIKRGKNYIYGPRKDTRIEEGDVLIANGAADGVDFLKEFADGTEDI